MQRCLPLFIGLLLWLPAILHAQPLPQYSAREQAQINSLQQTIQRYRGTNYERAVKLARQRNRPLEERRPDGTTLKLRGVSPHGELLYDATHSATRAGQSTRTSALYEGGSLGVALSGKTLTGKLGIWDGGKVLDTHIEFNDDTSGSRVTQADNATTSDVHATHVAGILVAAGKNTQVKGMAFGTNLRAYDFNNDDAEMAAAASNLLVSNHSYGAQAGWILNSSRLGAAQWEWWGDTAISATDDYKFGFYNEDARSWDQIAQNAPYYLIVKSAGNSHGSNGPASGQPHYLVSRRTISYNPRKDQDGYDQISTYGCAKNILTVGAISTLSFGYNQPSDVAISSFSSWGPTDDGRIKPDIVGVGVSVLSTSANGNSAYTTLSGTSMSSPNVAGSLLLLQELFSQRNSGRFMRSSTLKALAIHTADEAGDAPGPDYRNGWGLLNDEKAGRVILNTDASHLLDERTLNQGETYTLPVVASGRGPLVVTICWTDPAATVATATLNDRTIKLVNDLDIRISDGRQPILPWILNPEQPTQAATRGDNIRDNVEQIVIDNPIPGKSYTLTIGHKGTLQGGKQDLALLVSGIGGKAYCAATPPTAGSRIDRFQFSNVDQRGPENCATYGDFLQTIATVQASQQVPLSLTLGNCGQARNAVVKAFADWNQDGDFDDADETLATSGVLNGSATFTSAVAVPSSVQNGQFIRLRLVSADTDNPGAVSACGPVASGQIQDYLLRVVQTANDVGAVALVSPEANFCGQTNSDVSIAVRIRNFGTAEQRNIPVTVRITNAQNAEVTSLTGTVASVAAFRESVLTLKAPASSPLVAGQTYRFTVTTSLGPDQNNANNTFTDVRTTAAAPSNGQFTVTRCGNDTAFVLSNTGGGTAFWYDAASGNNLLGAGNRVGIRQLPTSGQFYAVLNDFGGTLGPVDKKAFGGGSYAGNFGPAPLISTQVPLLLESARLYIGSAGRLTFTVRRYDETAVSSVTLDVVPTRNQSLTATTNGQLVDDPNDAGAEYPLNLRIPSAGDYKITIDYEDGASIFRSNVGVNGFPYQLTTSNGTPIVTIKGSLFNTGTGIDTLKSAWYYFYNLKVRSLDCPAPQRVAVAVSPGTPATASITVNGSTTICQGANVTLLANAGEGLSYQWLRDGRAISGATSNTLRATTSGSYAVQVTSTCLPVTSTAVAVSVRTPQTPTITVDGFTLVSNAPAGNQWFLDGVPIPGATSQTYVVVQTGRYSVRGNVNGCGESLSNEVYLAILATEPDPDSGSLTVYPNPAINQVTVTFLTQAALKQPPTVQLIDSRGSLIRTAPLQRDGKAYSAQLPVADLPGGTFFVTVRTAPDQPLQVKRLRKQ
ncbi:peptidase S8 and S53 subtilisin kexin sedolisin [Fibrisoma limi BUZ 3]|uniref:Peptidase S8 and S53 subtilisin kexin sedolisin n=1 Tax=Fibrisoma limi BUZ 3 TaxID=1185876 RepID=I2GQI3_9BACT|nr:S8 family serine peptidase [Fibrisoma limi]CCH56161.1 peptidase S8 and S53 subtilisin kexin sedolisin [Fibrisoma limi BUZ 3]